MVKELNGKELVGFIKERQMHEARRLRAEGRSAKLVIIRDSDNPVIMKYVGLKQRYGEDIGVEVVDVCVDDGATMCEVGLDGVEMEKCGVAHDRVEGLKQAIIKANADKSVSGIIVQLPIAEMAMVDEVVGLIAPEKDVDGLSGRGKFDSATATAIHWLLTGYDIELTGKKIAVVGRGRLVGAPLLKMWRASSLDVTEFGRGSDLAELVKYDIIVTATGVPHLIKSEMVRAGAVVVDAGTASEDGVLMGDVDEAVRVRTDLVAITPKVGGVGPLTVGILFEHTLRAAGM